MVSSFAFKFNLRCYTTVDDSAVTKVTVPFVIGAEGNAARSAVVRAMDEDAACGVKMVRFEDKNPRVYKTVPIRLPTAWSDGKPVRCDLNYSARTKAGVALVGADWLLIACQYTLVTTSSLS